MGAFADVLDQLRGAVERIEPVAYGTWSVHSRPVDAATPPAFVIVWSDDPEQITRQTACTYAVLVDVLVIAGRVDVTETIDTVDAMTEALLAVAPFALRRAGAPGPFDLGNVRYLARRVTFYTVVTIGD